MKWSHTCQWTRCTWILLVYLEVHILETKIEIDCFSIFSDDVWNRRKYSKLKVLALYYYLNKNCTKDRQMFGTRFTVVIYSNRYHNHKRCDATIWITEIGPYFPWPSGQPAFETISRDFFSTPLLCVFLALSSVMWRSCQRRLFLRYGCPGCGDRGWLQVLRGKRSTVITQVTQVIGLVKVAHPCTMIAITVHITEKVFLIENVFYSHEKGWAWYWTWQCPLHENVIFSDC